MYTKKLHRHFFGGFVFLAAFLLSLSTFAQEQPTVNFHDLYMASEANGQMEAEADQLAISQGKPVSIYIRGEEILIEAKDIESNEPVYTIYHNLLKPEEGGEVAFWSDIENRFDLSNARINYGNGTILNPYDDSNNAQRIPTPDASLGILLIPESSNDRVMAFDRATGDLINADYIPADPGNLGTPIAATPNLTKSGNIFVSDQINDIVQEYTNTGTYVGVHAPAGGVDNSIIDNIRGVDFREGTIQNMLVTSADEGIAEFDTDGNFLSYFVPDGLGGLSSPFDITYFETRNTYLVGGINSEAIHEYDINGAYVGNFSAINSFPEQILELANGNALVANFTGTQEGIVEYNAAGAVIGVYDPAAVGGYRGIYELANGNLLTTNGGGVHEIDRAGNLVETKIAGVSARFIYEYNFQPISGGGGGAAIPTMGQWALLFFALLMMNLGIVYVHNHQTQLAMVNVKGGSHTPKGFTLPFDKKVYASVVPFTLLFALAGFFIIQLVWGEIIPDDLVGMVLTLPLVNYSLHFWKMIK